MKVYNGKVYGVAVSNYGLEKEYLDYQTLAKIVGDCILNNTVREETMYVLDIYVWAVTHYGTAWSHVLTDIKLVKED